MQSWTATVGPAASPPVASGWIRMDEWGGGQISFQTTVTGTVNYNVETTNDDPNSLINPVAVGSMNWDTGLSGVSGTTTKAYGSIAAIPLWIRIFLNSGSGSVRMTVTQSEGGGLW